MVFSTEGFLEYIYIYIYIYICNNLKDIYTYTFIYTYIYAIMKTPGYLHSGFVATHALGHMKLK